MSQAPYLPPVMSDVIVDLSHWDTVNADFGMAADYGIEGVILKATQGTTFVDPTFAARLTEVRDAGLLVGAYHFLTGEDPAAQAAHFLAVARDQGGVGWLAVDWESNPVAQATALQAAIAVMGIKMVVGYFPRLYMDRFMLSTPNATLSQCPLWLAEYGIRPICPPGFTEWELWQHTDGQVGNVIEPVPGIGYCDRSKFAGTVDELKAWWENPV